MTGIVCARLLGIVALVICATRCARADLADELFQRRAPSRDWRQAVRLYDEHNVPPDDAPLDVLAGFWASGRWYRSSLVLPNDTVRMRLVDAVVRDPHLISDLLPYFPDSPEAVACLKALHGTLRNDGLAEDGRELLADWLATRHTAFRDRLLKRIENAVHPEDLGEALTAMDKLHPEQARPLIDARLGAPDTATWVSAAVALHARHLRDGNIEGAAVVRRRLRSAAADRKAAPVTREVAIVHLAGCAWDGRDEWITSLFSDPSLTTIEDGSRTFTPLAHAAGTDAAHWLPRIAKLLRSPDPVVRDNAVVCLLFLDDPKLRHETRLALMPWLSDPAWSTAPGRLEFIETFRDADVPEALPGLIRIVAKENGAARMAAAKALARHRAGDAAPALLLAFRDEWEPERSREIARALVACDALSDDRIAAAVEAASRASAANVQDAAPAGSPRLLGEALIDLAPARDGAAALLLARADALRAAEPAVASAVLDATSRWPCRAVHQRLLTRLRAGLDVPTCDAVLRQAPALRKTSPAELRDLARAGGDMAGLAAGILGEPDVTRAILAADDAAARRMLLAAARLSRMPLPLDSIAKLLADSKADAALVRAAECYLVADDSPAARKLLLARYPGKGFVLGGYMGFGAWLPDDDDGPPLTRAGEALRAEILAPGGPDEVIALLTRLGGYHVVVRLHGDRAVLSVIDGDRTEVARLLTPAERRDLLALLGHYAFDDLPELETDVLDGAQFEYLRLRRDGGRMVHMNNPGMSGSEGSAYEVVTRHFLRLAYSGGLVARD